MPRAEGTAPAAARPCIPRARKKRYLDYINIMPIRRRDVAMEMDKGAGMGDER